jgi:hypothetical protein
MLQGERHVARLGFIDFYAPLGDPGLDYVKMCLQVSCSNRWVFMGREDGNVISERT